MGSSIAGSAQDFATAALDVVRGRVMTSQGGAFTIAQGIGQVVASGNRVLITENSVATMTFSDGCRQTYNTPGVYTVGRTCAPGDSVDGTAAGIQVESAVKVNSITLRVTSIVNNFDHGDAAPLPVGR